MTAQVRVASHATSGVICLKCSHLGFCIFVMLSIFQYKMQYIFLEKNVNIMDLLVTELRDGFPGGRGGGGCTDPQALAREGARGCYFS